MKVSLFFARYDFWVGFFYDQKKRTLYICPLPMVVIKIEPKVQPTLAWELYGVPDPYYTPTDEEQRMLDRMEDPHNDWHCESCGQELVYCVCEVDHQ